MSKYLTKKEVERMFKEEVYPSLNKSDKPMIREAWINFIDMLCKDGEISDKQYNTWSTPSFIK